MAPNLNVAAQPAVAEVAGYKSKMDFRSNEAGRTAPLEIEPGTSQPSRFSRGRIPYPVDATDRGRRSFVAHHENRNALSRLYRRAETLSGRFCHGFADQQGRARRRWWQRR